MNLKRWIKWGNSCFAVILVVLGFYAAPAALATYQAPPLVLQIGPQGRADSMAISPNDRLIAVASQFEDVTIWDIRTRIKIRSFHVAGNYQLHIAFSTDGGTLAVLGGQDRDAEFYDVASGRMVRHFSIDAEPAGIAFSPDGKTLAVAGTGSISLWNYHTGQKLHAMTVHNGEMFDNALLAFSPDGSVLAECEGGFPAEGPVELWDTATGTLRTTFNPGCAVGSLVFSPDGTKIALGTARFPDTGPLVEIWDIASARKVSEIDEPRLETPCPSNDVTSVAFGHDGTMTFAIDNGTFCRWDMAAGKPMFEAGGGSFVIPTTVSADGRLAAASLDDASIQIFDASTGKVSAIAGNPITFTQPAFSGDGSSLFQAGTLALDAANDGKAGELAMWDTATGELRSVALCPDVTFDVSGGNSDIAAVHGYFHLYTWDTAKNLLRPLAAEKGHYFCACALSPDGSIVAALKSSIPTSTNARPVPATTMALYSTQTGTLIRSLPQSPTDFIDELMFTPDGGTLFGVSPEGRVNMWRVATGALSHPLAIQGFARIAISRDGRMAATSTNSETADIYSISTGRKLRSIPVPGVVDQSLALSADGRLLALDDGDGTIQVLDTISGRRREILPTYATCASLSFSPDGRILICGEPSGRVQLWDPWSGRLRATLFAFGSGERGAPHLYWLAVTPAGYYDGSPGVEKFLTWRIDGVVQASPALAARYHRPDLIQTALSGQAQPSRATMIRAQEVAAEQMEQQQIAEMIAAQAAKNKPAPPPTTPNEKLRAALSTFDLLVEDVASQQANQIKDALLTGADPNTQGEWVDTALQFFAYTGDADEVKWLIAHKVDINEPTSQNDSALVTAAGQGHNDIVQILLNAGAKFTDASGHDLLALRGNRKALGQALVDVFEATTRIRRIRAYDDNGRARLLLQLGADPNVRDPDGRTPLMFADYGEDSTPLLLDLLAAGGDVNARDKRGATALAAACQFDGTPIVRLLLEHGAIPNLADAQGWTPLLWTSMQGRTESAGLLLDHGADPNIAVLDTDDQRTPLIFAAEGGYLTIAEDLVAHGAHINAHDGYDNSTALTEAVRRLDATMVRLFLAHGADVSVRTKDSETLLQLDKDQDPSDTFGIAALLRQAGEKS